jgi:hypothetical protein
MIIYIALLCTIINCVICYKQYPKKLKNRKLFNERLRYFKSFMKDGPVVCATAAYITSDSVHIYFDKNGFSHYVCIEPDCEVHGTMVVGDPIDLSPNEEWMDLFYIGGVRFLKSGSNPKFKIVTFRIDDKI